MQYVYLVCLVASRWRSLVLLNSLTTWPQKICTSDRWPYTFVVVERLPNMWVSPNFGVKMMHVHLQSLRIRRWTVLYMFFFGGVPVWWFQFDNMNFTWLTNWIGSFLCIIPTLFFNLGPPHFGTNRSTSRMLDERCVDHSQNVFLVSRSSGLMLGSCRFTCGFSLFPVALAPGLLWNGIQDCFAKSPVKCVSII